MKLSKSSFLVPGLASLLSVSAFADTKNQPNSAPVVGVSEGVVGVTVEEEVLVARGWSVKKSVLGKYVYNDKNEKVGKIEDVIFSPEKSLSYAIVGAGGFLGLARHDVAIPISRFKFEKDHFVLSGATKDVLKSLPAFEYAKQ